MSKHPDQNIIYQMKQAKNHAQAVLSEKQFLKRIEAYTENCTKEQHVRMKLLKKNS